MTYGYRVWHKDCGWVSCNRGYVSWDIAMEYAKSDIRYFIKRQAMNGFATVESDFDIDIFIV